MDGPWPEGAKQDLNQFERGGREEDPRRAGVLACILRRGGECLCVCGGSQCDSVSEAQERLLAPSRFSTDRLLAPVGLQL